MRAFLFLRTAALALCLPLALSLGCGGGGLDDPEAVSIAFLELYVYEANQEKALRLADGLAAEKLRKEIEAVGPQRQSGGFEEIGSRPPVHRELLSEEKSGGKSDGESVVYTYLVEIRPKGSDPFARNMLIHLSRKPTGWRVVNYDFWSAP